MCVTQIYPHVNKQRCGKPTICRSCSKGNHWLSTSMLVLTHVRNMLYTCIYIVYKQYTLYSRECIILVICHVKNVLYIPFKICSICYIICNA